MGHERKCCRLVPCVPHGGFGSNVVTHSRTMRRLGLFMSSSKNAFLSLCGPLHDTRVSLEDRGRLIQLARNTILTISVAATQVEMIDRGGPGPLGAMGHASDGIRWHPAKLQGPTWDEQRVSFGNTWNETERSWMTGKASAFRESSDEVLK